MLDGSVPMALGDSLLLSGIGILMVFFELALLAGLIMIISKVIRDISGKDKAAVAVSAPTPVATPAPVVEVSAPAALPTSLTLTDVDEPTAATVMAVVSHQTGIALNHLAFRSIKGTVELNGVEERDAAVIMALTAHQLQKPVNKLVFKSIKKI